MGADEKLVMDTWDSPRFDWSYQHGDPFKPKYWLFYVGDWLVISGYDTRDQIAASAAEFTRNRLEEIRQVEEEICVIGDQIDGADRGGHPWGLVFRRIWEREKAALADLKRGIKG